MDDDKVSPQKIGDNTSLACSTGAGKTEVTEDYGADSGLRRALSTRHITMVALSSSIGMGLWLGSGTSLIQGGPAAMVIGYVIAGSMIWAVAQSMGEMAIMYPLPSAFVQWTDKFVDPAAGFALGWAYWFSYWISIATEMQGVLTVLQFWNTSVPAAVWITIWLVFIIGINIGPVRLFGEFEVISSVIKFGWIFVVIISCIVISAGGAPNHEAVGFRYWNQTHGFTNGFKGFLSVMPTCIFAISGSENSALLASETISPRKSMPQAVRSMWARLALFYIAGSLMVTITVSPFNGDLFGAQGTNASPYVIAYREAKLEPLAHMMNAVIFISVISGASIAGYGGSRTLVGLSQIGMAPQWFQRTDGIGRPWYALLPTLAIGGGLSYLNVSNSGPTVFGWFSSLSYLFSLFGWGMICLSHIRMRHAWKVQGRSVEELPWDSGTYPWAPWWCLIWCIVLTFVELYLSVWPLGASPSVETFFANYISVPVIVLTYVGAKVYYRGRRWVDSGAVNLDEGRRFYSHHEEEEEEQTERTNFGKFLNYVKRL